MTYEQLKKALESFRAEPNSWTEVWLQQYKNSSFPGIAIYYSTYWGTFYAGFRNEASEFKTYPDFNKNFSDINSCDCCQ